MTKKKKLFSSLIFLAVMGPVILLSTIETRGSSNIRSRDSMDVDTVHFSEESDPHSVKEETHTKSHEAAESIDHDHPAEIPMIYLFYWGILILVMVIILIYFIYRVKRKQEKPLIPLAIFFILFVLSIYILEIMAPVFTGKFDLATLRVVHKFHEGTNLGFMRFIYKFLLGIFLTVFAFLNLDRKRFFSFKKKMNRE